MSVIGAQREMDLLSAEIGHLTDLTRAYRIRIQR